MIKVKAITGPIKYTTEISARRHQIIVDEPINLEGKDEGMTPMELLAASLASCTSITLKMYILRKQWEVNSIYVSITIEQDKVNKTTIFHRVIQWEGRLEEQQQKRLLNIANACPVHKILENSNIINTELSFSE